MGAKKINQYWLIQNGVMSGTSTINSTPQYVFNQDNLGLEVSWTGTPTGTITVLGSISQQFQDAGATATFYSFTFGPALPQPAGSGGSFLVNLNQVPFPYIKVSYTNVSGSGTLNVFLSGKDLN